MIVEKSSKHGPKAPLKTDQIKLTINEIKRKINRASVVKWGKDGAIHLVGFQPDFQKLILQLERLASCDNPILIFGESGTGKDLLAKAIFLLSERKANPFLSVNCAQFHDEHLLMSELFGHKKGSFTGAFTDHIGIFETADKGYVFLDEIGDLSIAAQSKLLRVIEQKEIRPVGSSHSKIVDIRFIMATHRDLSKLVKENKFREDLYFRLHCHQIRIPPLRKRREDILFLTEHFLTKLNNLHGIEKKLSNCANDFFMHYHFPGNIRELRNMIERGWWNSDNDKIELSDLGLSENPSDDDERVENNLYRQITSEGKSFWETVYEPFMNRDLNRKQVREIVQKGLELAKTNKELCDLFNIEVKDRQTFINFLYKQKIRPG